MMRPNWPATADKKGAQGIDPEPVEGRDGKVQENAPPASARV